MQINQTFVLNEDGNVEYPDVFLCRRNHSKIGLINNVENLKIIVNEKASDEISFDTHKYLDNIECSVWDKLTDLRCVYVKGFGYFEISVTTTDENEVVKSVVGMSQAHNELSQINATLEINTDVDLEIHNGKLTQFYDNVYKDCSLLHRILTYAPHYKIGTVDVTLQNITKEFTFDTDIMSIFDEISEENECLFVVDSETRTVNVYDLKNTCKDCLCRKVKDGVCTKCGSKNIKYGYGKDTQVFISSENLADTITLEGDKDSVKNCLKIKSADELMDAAVAQINPNGTNKIYKFTDIQLQDMSKELVEKLSEYNTVYNSSKAEYEELYNKILTSEQTIANYQYNMSPTLETVSGYTCDEMMQAVMDKYNGNKIAVLNYSSISGTTAQNNVKRRIKQMLAVGFELSFGDYTFSNNVYTGEITIKDTINSTETNIISNTQTITVTLVDADSDDEYKTYTEQEISDILKKVNIDKIDTIMSHLDEWSISMLSNYSKAIEECISKLIEIGCGVKPISTSLSLQGEKYNLYLTWREYLEKINNRIKELDELLEIETAKKETYEKRRQEIQDSLNIVDFLGKTLWYELCSYIREDTYDNSNFSSEFDSDELKPDKIIKRAKELYELAEEELDKASVINYSLTATLHNLLVMKEFKVLKDKIEIGNYIRVEVDGELKKLKLISIEFDFENIDMISMTFSDVVNAKDETSAIKSILNQAASVATSFDSVKRKSDKGNKTFTDFQKIKNEGLSAALFNIKNADEENFLIGQDGVTMKRGNEESGYDDRQLKIIHNMIAMTDDGWNSVRLAIGQGKYNGQDVFGVWGDVIVGNILCSEQLLISNESGTFTVDKDGIVVYNMKLDLMSDDTRLLIDPKLKSLFNIYNLKEKKQTFYIDNNGNLSMLGNLYINNNNIYCKIDMESENIIEVGRGTIIDAGNEGESSKEENVNTEDIDSSSPNVKKMEWTKNIENISSISADKNWTSSVSVSKITQGNLTTKNGNTYILQEVNSYSKVIKKFNKDNNNWDVITDLYIFDIDCLKNYNLLLIKDDFEDNCLYIYCYYKGRKTGNHTYTSYIVKYDIDVDMASIYKNIEFSWVKTNDISDYDYNTYSEYNYNPEKAFIKNNILLLEGMAYRTDYFPYRITYNLDITGDTVSTYKIALHYDYLCDIVDVNGIQYAVTKNTSNSFISLKKIKDFENMIFENINGVSSISTIKCYYGSGSYSYKNGDCVQVCLHDNSIFIFYPKSLYEYVGFEYDLSANNLKQLIDMPPFYITNNNDLMYIGSICFSDGDYMHFYNTSYFYTYHSYQMHVYGEDYINLLLHYIYIKNNYIKTSGNFKELTDHSKDIEKFGQFGYYYNSGYIYSIDIDGNPIRLNVKKDGDKSWETFTTYKFNNGDYHLIKTNSKDALYAIGDNYNYTSIYRMDLTNGNVDNIYYFNNSGYKVASTESFYDEINSKLYYCTTRSFNKFAVLDMPIVKDGSGNIIKKTVSTPTELYDNNTWILSNFIFDEDELCYYWVGSYKENNADVYLCKFDFNTHKIENVAIMISVCDYITYAAFTIFRYNNKISLLCAKRGLMNKERYVCDLQTKTVEIKEDVFQDLGGYYKNTYLDVCRTISNVVVGTPYGVYFWNSYPFYVYNDKNSIKCYSSYVYTENETPPEVDDPEKILNDCTWFEIENIANAGDAEKYFNIGDEKTITIDGIDYQVAIADFNHDDLTNRNSKAKISFTLKGCLGDLHSINSANINTGGWGTSEIRYYLNVELIQKFQTELSAIIKPVKKTTSKENGLSGIETTYDKLWLFSEKEIFGTTVSSVDGEGKQYPYYNNEDRKDKGNSYWLRSPSQIDNENFCEVYYSTTSSSMETELSNASSLNGITFGFCIGNGGSSNATTVAPTSDKILYVTNDGSASFHGNVYAANGYFHGDVYAENGYFKGDVYADSGYFKGDIVATSLKLGSDIKIDSSNITGLPEKISDLEGSNVLLKTDDIKITTTKNDETGITTTATTFNGTTYTTYTSTDGDYVITNIGLGDESTEGKPYFVVSNDGLLRANNAIIQGRIIANAGSIGGWNIEYDKTFGSYLQSTDSKTSGEMQLLAKNGEIRSRGNYYDTSSDGWYARLYSGKWIFGLYDSTDPWQTGDDRYSDISVNGIFMRSKQCINSGTNQYLLQADTSNDLVSITSSSSNPALSITNNSTGNCLYLENVSCGYVNAAFRSKVVCNLMVDGTIAESRSGYVTLFGEANKGRIVFRADKGTNVSGYDNFEYSSIGTVGWRWGEGYFNDLYSVGAVNTSDLKLKDVIGDLDITQSIDFIKSLKPISFTFKDSEHKRIHMGFGAQDVAKSCKDLNMGDMSIYTAIGFDDDGNEMYYKEDIPEEKLEWGIKYNELIAPIVKTLQYQQNIIEELQKEINELKEK